MRKLIVILACAAALGACGANIRDASEAPTPAAPLLAGSTPADGATAAAPVNELVLRFSPPARLGEVTVSGPNGLMPMMITAVGEVPTYTLPVPGLGAGRYTVTWKASAAGAERQGSFSFTVR